MFKKVILCVSLAIFIAGIIASEPIPFYGGLLALILGSLPIIFRKIKRKLSSKKDRKRKKYEDFPLWFKILVFFGIWVGFIMFGFMLSAKVLNTTDTGIGIITAICFWIGLVVALLLAFHPSYYEEDEDERRLILAETEEEESYASEQLKGGTKSKTIIVPVEYYTIDAMLDQNKILWNKTERIAWREYDRWKVGKKIINVTLKRCPYLNAVEGSVVKICVIYE